MGVIIRDNSPKYWEQIRVLRNDPRVKDGFIQQADIDEESHKKYMEKHGSKYRVAFHGTDGQFAGYYGVIDDDIRVCVKPEYQGFGIAAAMLADLRERNPDAIAKVKITNERSLALFLRGGFKLKYFVLEQ